MDDHPDPCTAALVNKLLFSFLAIRQAGQLRPQPPAKKVEHPLFNHVDVELAHLPMDFGLETTMQLSLWSNWFSVNLGGKKETAEEQTAEAELLT